MVEADPIDPVAAAAGVAIAGLDSPLRRMAVGDVGERAFHRAALPGHASRLPLTIDADVERDRIMKDQALRSAHGHGKQDGDCGGREYPVHRRPKRYSRGCVPQPLNRDWLSLGKQRAAAPCSAAAPKL